MKKAILATKVGMTQIFNEDGVLVPVTVLQAGPCVVTKVKTKENDGYESVQVAFGEIRAKLVNKPNAGQLEKAGIEKVVIEKGEGKREVYPAGRFIREFRFENASEYSVKDEIKADIFASSIVIRVPTVPLPIRAVSSRARECRATWVMSRSPRRTLRSSALMPRTT